MLIYIITLLGGFCVWYLYYGLECFINGASIGRNQYWQMHWDCFWEELSWFLPGGRVRKIRYLKERKLDKEDLDMLPGPFHFIFTHILIPFGPAILVFIKFNWR